MQERRPDRIAGRFDCTDCGVMIHAWSGAYDYPIWRIYPDTETLLEVAILPMCQSPKIVNVLVHAKGLPANDN
jgi:hypothetical protein